MPFLIHYLFARKTVRFRVENNPFKGKNATCQAERSEKNVYSFILFPTLFSRPVCSFPENLLRFVVGFSFPLGQLSKVTTNLFPSFSIVMRLGVERVRSSSAVFASFGMLDCSSQGLPEA